jgi:hypothetical protein
LPIRHSGLTERELAPRPSAGSSGAGNQRDFDSQSLPIGEPARHARRGWAGPSLAKPGHNGLCSPPLLRCFRCYGTKFTASVSSFLTEILDFRSSDSRNNSGMPAVLSLFFAVLFVENSERDAGIAATNPFTAPLDDPHEVAISWKSPFVNLITLPSRARVLAMAMTVRRGARRLCWRAADRPARAQRR